MPIAVTCPKCLTRFSVSEKFAGKKGPCPKCKNVITVPELSEQVTIHAPRDDVPKDSKGQSVLKPIRRREVVISRLLIGASLGGILVVVLLAAVLRLTSGTPVPLRVVAALAVAPPIVRFGYAITRDSELEPFLGQELWVRVGIASLVLSASWLVYVLAAPYALDYDYASQMSWVEAGIALVVMLGLGAVASMAVFELEFFGGLIVAGAYVTATLLLAIIAGVSIAGVDTGLP